MKTMHETMEDGSHQDTHGSQQNNPGIQCIKGSKDLAGIGLQGVNGTHSPQDHGGIQKGIDPGKRFKIVITQYTYGKRKQDDPGGNQAISQYAPRKFSLSGQWLRV